MRAAALGLALSAAIACGACGATSGLEGFGIFNELIAKGRTASQEADDMIKRDRPEQALVLMRVHVRDVDDAIAKVENDQLMNDRDKVRAIKMLREYQREFKQSADRLRAMISFQSELGRR